MSKLLGAFAAVALLAGCAHTSAKTATTTDTFSLNSNTAAYTATLTPSEVTGPDYQVSRFPGGFRGTVFGAPIELHVAEGAVTGTYGSAPVSLHLDRVGQQNEITQIQGLYGGVLSNLQVSTGGIQGKIGKCSYSLQRTGGVLAGQSVCGGSGQVPTTVNLPPRLLDAPTADQAAELVMLLGQ